MPLKFSADILTAPPEALVCYCSQVSKGDILAAMRAGAKTLEDIKRATGACRVSRCKELSPRRR
ncbi:MAG: (2Fe-2S)-binding protein [Desulfarculaceae bacterium]|nr:(2Fe-2S)-binding protein [Desulfarculaceae bacterium]MCF8120979.1 (2Fe-2S)-binding protein [Desulfarculaceae bacterium]